MKTLFAFTLSLFVGSFSVADRLCGLSGTIEERINDCNTAVGVDGEFQLVVHADTGVEVYRGRHTGVVWSADLPEPLNYLRSDVDTVCDRPHAEFGGLDDLNWELPTAGKFINGLDYGIQSSLPRMNGRTYWTSSIPSFYVNSRYVFEGGESYQVDEDGGYYFSHWEIEDAYAYVKCVASTF